MKKGLMALAIALVFIASTTFAATHTMIMFSSENDGSPDPGSPSGFEAGMAGPTITSDYTFTIDTTGGVITNFTNLFSNYFYTYSAGGYDPRDGGPFAAGEQIYPNGVQQSVSISFDGNTAGTTMWFKAQSNPTGPLGGLVFNVGLLAITYDPITEVGIAAVGPNLNLQEQYIFHSVPIPGALWLLGSGLIGLVGFRKKVRKA